jgi:hypothetical protein
MPNLWPSRLRRAEASSYLREKHCITRAPGTLTKLAVIGGGPLFRKVGSRHVLYDVVDLDRWANELVGSPIRSTSDEGDHRD